MREIKPYKITIFRENKGKKEREENEKKKALRIVLFVLCQFSIPREKIKYWKNPKEMTLCYLWLPLIKKIKILIKINTGICPAIRGETSGYGNLKVDLNDDDTPVYPSHLKSIDSEELNTAPFQMLSFSWFSHVCECHHQPSIHPSVGPLLCLLSLLTLCFLIFYYCDTSLFFPLYFSSLPLIATDEDY